MSIGDIGTRIRPPWHQWVVGIVGLLWNGMGCLDFTMTQTQGDAWLAQMDPSEMQMAWFHAMPAWTHATWGIGVWGGLLGALLLLVRRKWAMPVFVVSFFGWVASAVYAFGLSNGLEAMGATWPIEIVHGVAGVFFIWYAWMMTKRGVLR